LPLQGEILVVDDAPDIRMLVQKICQSFGLQVVSAENGLQAVDLCQQSLRANTPYNLVLMDIHMPILGGREAIGQIRQAGFSAPVIALTAAALKGVKHSLIGIGFSDVLHKPINKNALYRSLSEYLPQQADNQIKADTQSKHQEQQILLVEDDADAAEVSKLLLESLGLSVSVANNGAQCLSVLQSSTAWTKVLLDLNLPDTNGLTLASQIRQINTQVEIILVSGAQVDTQQLIAVDIHRSLLKPLNLTSLKTLLN
jgi:two-component system, sensor histidine kinase and response regulator